MRQRHGEDRVVTARGDRALGNRHGESSRARLQAAVIALDSVRHEYDRRHRSATAALFWRAALDLVTDLFGIERGAAEHGDRCS